MRLTLAQATEILNAALVEANSINVAMNIAVIDANGILKTFARQDGAWLGSVDIAERKARTAWLFKMDTEVLGELSQPGQPLWGIEHSNGGLITFAGGLPILDHEDHCFGAIGVSGGSVEQDRQCAVAGSHAIEVALGLEFSQR